MKYFHENRKYNDNLKISCGISKNLEFQAHYHNDIEIFCVIKGKTNIGINAEIIELSVGDTAFISGGDIHYYQKPLENYESIMLIISRELVDAEIRNELSSVIIDKSRSADIRHLMEAVLKEKNEKKDRYDLICKNYIGLIVLNILRGKDDFQNIGKLAGHGSTMKKFQDMLEFIDNNYENPLKLSDAAELMHYSTWYFSKFFKKLTGTSFIKYINQKKVTKAKQLIKENELNFTNISSLCGFENIRTFNREFKLVTGKTPKEYRQSI